MISPGPDGCGGFNAKYIVPVTPDKLPSQL